MTSDSTLTAFVSHYVSTSRDQLSAGYVQQLGIAVNLLDRHAGHRVTLSDLSDPLINGYCDWLTSLGRSPDTVRGRRNSILCLWREAFQQGILDVPPLRIRRIRSRRRMPRAWTAQQVADLLRVAMEDTTYLHTGVVRGLWFGSLISAGWDTALRLGDLLRLQYDQIAETVRIVQHKTGDEVLVRFSPNTLDLIARLRRQTRDALVWPLWAARREFYRQFVLLRNRAGLDTGTFKWIRRASITAVEAAGGNGSTHAGHRSRTVTERHYLDASQLTAFQISPPPLDSR